MDAVAYPHKDTIQFIAENMVALRIASDTPLMQEFRVVWTPTLVTLDWEGAEHHRTVGFMAPDELIPSLMLGCAKVFGDLELFDKAFAAMKNIVAGYPASDTAPEAYFIEGVYGYKSTHEPAPLKEAYEQLNRQYPQNQWTKRAYPYRLL